MKVTDLVREISEIDDRVFIKKEGNLIIVNIKINNKICNIAFIPDGSDDWIGLTLYKFYLQKSFNKIQDVLQ